MSHYSGHTRNFAVAAASKPAPANVVMAGVHRETGKRYEFSAGQIDHLRSFPLEDAGRRIDISDINGNQEQVLFRRKEWDFHCPCCGEGTSSVHVKAHTREIEGKAKLWQAHWLLSKESWHDNPECVSFDPTFAVFKTHNLDVDYDPEKGFEIRLNPSRGVKTANQNSAVSSVSPDVKPRKSAALRTSRKSFSVSTIDAFIADLSLEQLGEVYIREGRTKRPIMEVWVQSGQHLVDLVARDMGAEYNRPIKNSYILAVTPDLETMKCNADGLWTLLSYPEIINFQNQDHGLVTEILITDAVVLNLFESGGVKSGGKIRVRVDLVHYSSPVDAILYASNSADSRPLRDVRLYASIGGVDEFVRGARAPYAPLTVQSELLIV